MLAPQGAITLVPAAHTATPCGLPEPILSSRSRNWDGIVVELRRGRDIDVEIPYRDHAVAVFLAGGANLYQRRNGRGLLRTLRSGDVIITPAGEAKRWQHAEEAVGIVLRLSPSYVRSLTEDDDPEPAGSIELRDNFGTRDPYIEEAALRLLKALESQASVERLYVESLTSKVALHLIRHYSARTPASVAVRKRSAILSQHKLRLAMGYIEAHIGDDLTLHDIAAVLAMSSGHFAHAFRQTVGMPPHRYVLCRRMERAKSLLRSSDLPITQIAQQIGFSSPSSFSFLFHRATGVTPRSYRNSKPSAAPMSRPF